MRRFVAWLRSGGNALAPLRVLLVLSVLGPLLLLAAGGWYTRRVAFDNADRDLARIGDVAREHALKVFDTHRLIADQADDMVENVDDATVSLRQAELHHALAVMIAGLPQAVSVTITNRDGLPLVSADPYPVPTDTSLADRDYFVALRDGTARTYVSRVYRRRLSPGTFFGLARRRDAAEGRFAGVVNVLVAPEYFSTFYRTLLGEATGDHDGMELALVRADGAVLVRFPELPNESSRLSPNSPFFRVIGGHPGGGNYSGPSLIDSGAADGHYAYRLVGEHGVYVVSGRLTSAIYADWLRDLASYGLVGVPAMIGLVLITLSALRRTRREQAALVQVRQEMDRREIAEEALRQAQKLEAVGQLTAGVAHDFNNLLTVILGNLEFLKATTGANAAAQQRIAPMEAAAERGARLTAQLLAFSRRQTLQPQPLDLDAVVSGMAEMLRSTMGGTVRVELQRATGLWPALADRTQLELALLNLAINARDAMSQGGTLTVDTRNATLDQPTRLEDPPAGDYVAVSLTDTGAGMTPEVLARVFEPFFTTKPVGHGSGLGLSQVYGFAQQSGGGVAIRSAPGAGTTVRVYLPRSAAAPGSSPGLRRDTTSATERTTVLVVDDDPDVRRITASMLNQLGHRVIQAESGADALSRLAERPLIGLAVIDFAMPEMNGIELADRLRADNPTLPVLFVTGYADTDALAARPQGDLVLHKPFTLHELTTQVAATLRTRRPAQVNGVAGR